MLSNADADYAAADVDEVAEAGYAALVAELALAYQDESTDGPSLIEQIVAGAVAVIKGVVGAAVEQRQGGQLTPQLVEGDDVVTRLLEAENAAGSGISQDAWSDWQQMFTADVHVDPRWIPLGTDLASRRIGVRAVICTPMEVDGRKVGMLTLVGDKVDFGRNRQDDDILVLARIFAAHAAIALYGRNRHDQMVSALSSRDLIGQAKGILMERFKITGPTAFAMLIEASKRTNTKLRTVCERLSETGELNRTPQRVRPPAPSSSD